MTVDVHHHYVSPSMALAIENTAANPASPHASLAATYLPGMSQLTSTTARLVEMDSAGIDYALLSASPVAVELSPGDTYADFVRRCNDELLATTAIRPDRWGAMITLPLPDPEACLAELTRLGTAPGVRAIIAPAAVSEWTLDAPALEPVLAAAAELGLTVLLHPAFEPTPDVFGPWRLDTGLYAPTLTSLTAARLALSGVLDRLPKLDIIVPHLGGVLPYLAQRLSDQGGSGDAAHDITYYLRNRFWFDTCSFHHPALRCAIDTVSADRLLLATDFPFRGPMNRAVTDIESADLTAEQRKAILGGNAARWRGSNL